MRGCVCVCVCVSDGNVIHENIEECRKHYGAWWHTVFVPFGIEDDAAILHLSLKFVCSHFYTSVMTVLWYPNRLCYSLHLS